MINYAGSWPGTACSAVPLPCAYNGTREASQLMRASVNKGKDAVRNATFEGALRAIPPRLNYCFKCNRFAPKMTPRGPQKKCLQPESFKTRGAVSSLIPVSPKKARINLYDQTWPVIMNKDNPRWPKDGPKMVPRWSQEDPYQSL